MTPGDTIVAPATPYGMGGLAVVRLSGPEALPITRRMVAAKEDYRPIPRQAVLITLVTASGEPFDEAVVTYFQAPRSYSGEDLVEFSCHGSPAVVDQIVALGCEHGARLAAPGEFTRRAFENGKLDLVQAESVAALIASQSFESSQLSYRLLAGSLSRRLAKIKAALITLLARVEFELDVSEEELTPDLGEQLEPELKDLIAAARQLLDTYQQGRLFRSGATVVIAGAPNVGKSTLLNTLSETDRAITSSTPGTTRDAIDVALFMDGVPIRLVDTAGLRETPEELEREGVRRTRSYLERADLILSLRELEELNNGAPLQAEAGVPVLEVVNKQDLYPDRLEGLREAHPESIFISALTGAGLDELRDKIKVALRISPALSSGVMLTTSRQQRVFTECHRGLVAARELFQQNPMIPCELVALELHSALEAIDQLLGKTTPDEILEQVFGQFCVGK